MHCDIFLSFLCILNDVKEQKQCSRANIENLISMQDSAPPNFSVVVCKWLTVHYLKRRMEHRGQPKFLTYRKYPRIGRIFFLKKLT